MTEIVSRLNTLLAINPGMVQELIGFRFSDKVASAEVKTMIGLINVIAADGKNKIGVHIADEKIKAFYLMEARK